MKLISIRKSQRPFKAHRDEAGIPHIHAPTWEDALYGLGYLHATDRPTQMLFARTLARGRAAELIADKPELLETDRLFRKVGLYRHLDQEIDELRESTRRDLHAYCEGVNDGMKQRGRSLPMWAVGFQPSDWDLRGVMLVCNLLNYGGLAITQQQNERLLVELMQAGIEPELLKELFDPLLNEANFDLIKQVKIPKQLSDEALELIGDLPRMPGSNAWAIGPSRSASGHALLAADPHLEINRLPAIFYEAVLHWEGGYVMGATLPGSPLFTVARTRNLAWGVTYIKGDTSDYFIEDCRQGERGWQYRRGTHWHDFDVREEVILRKGGGEERLKIYHNALGTLEGDPDQTGPGHYLVTTWTGDFVGAGRALDIWMELVHTRDTLRAMALCRDLPQPTLCWVFADRSGHIGRQASGRFPKRRPGHSGLLPVPAWDEQNHWHGWLSSEALPGIYDPTEGFVSSANENINSPGGPLLVTAPVPDYRKRRIDQRLREMTAATLGDMQNLQYDVVSMQARDLLRVFLAHLPDGPLRRRLAAWDCSYEPDSTEATLFARLYRQVLLEIFGAAPGGIGWRRMLYLCTRMGFSSMVLTCIDRLLQREHSRWWERRDKGELIRRAAQQVENGPDQPWSSVNSFYITNRFFDQRFFGQALGFHPGELPMRGCFATPFQGHLLRSARRETTFAPAYHFVTDLGTDEAWTNLPGGPSESRFSRFYKTDLERWLDGEYKRLDPS